MSRIMTSIRSAVLASVGVPRPEHWRVSTADMAGARETPGFAEAPHVVIVPGGIPVFSVDGPRGTVTSGRDAVPCDRHRGGQP